MTLTSFFADALISAVLNEYEDTARAVAKDEAERQKRKAAQAKQAEVQRQIAARRKVAYS